jgi:hypothetical protein
MAIRFVDSFDHYDSTEIDLKWTLKNGNMSLGSGRHGNGLVFGNGVPVVSITIDFQTTWICGWAVKWDNAGATPTNSAFLEIVNISTDNTLLNVIFRPDSIIEMRCADTVIADSSPFQLHPGTWYYIEVKVTFSDDSGKVKAVAELRVDGAVQISGSATSTKNTSSLYLGEPKANRIIFGGLGGSGFSTTTIDDLYVADGNAGDDSPNNDYQGDIIVEPIFPNGDTATADWALTPGSGSGFSHINEVPPDGDTTYISSANTGDKSLFDWEDIPTFTGTVKAVQLSVFARKDDEGSRPFNVYAVPVATEYHKAKQYVNDNYLYYRNVWDGNPETAAAWTRAEFNAAKFGFRIDAP